MPKKINSSAFLDQEQSTSLDVGAEEVVSTINSKTTDNNARFIPISLVDDFKGHTFKVKDDEDMKRLMASIEKSGRNMVAAVVRPKKNGRFELISGHRRKHALERIGKDQIWALVQDMSDDDARELMIVSNFESRSGLDESEKIKAFHELMELRKKKRGRKRGEGGQSQDTARLIADELDLPRTTLVRYLSMYRLSDAWLEQLDNKKIAFMSAYHISFLSDENQKVVLKVIEDDYASLTIDRAEKIRKAESEGKLTSKELAHILTRDGELTASRPKLKLKDVQDLIPKRVTPDEYKSYLGKAIRYYEKYLKETEKKS